MKKVSKINLLLCAFGCISMTQHTNTFMDTSKAVAATAHHTVIKDLNGKIYEIVQKYVSHFRDLTISNLSEKVVHIENLRVDLLFHIKRAESRASYSSLIAALESLNIRSQSLQAINTFKQILTLLPETTRNLIKNTITDTSIKRFLNL